MLGKSILDGFTLILRRLRLVVLIYALNAVLVFLVLLPLYRIIAGTVADTGFGEDLFREFDVLLWSEILLGNRESFVHLLRRIVWVIPVFWIWKTAVQMGVIYALHQGAIWPFWSGVYFYTVRGLLLGLIFLPFKAAWIVSIYMGAVFLSSNYLTGEVEVFWLMGVATPFLLLTGLAIIDLYQRYGRLALVVRNDRVLQALRTGFNWPQQYSEASLVYISWYVIAASVFLISLGLNATLHIGVPFLMLTFLVQQAIMFLRSAVTVGWIGSEVFLFERIGARQ